MSRGEGVGRVADADDRLTFTHYVAYIWRDMQNVVVSCLTCCVCFLCVVMLMFNVYVVCHSLDLFSVVLSGTHDYLTTR